MNLDPGRRFAAIAAALCPRLICYSNTQEIIYRARRGSPPRSARGSDPPETALGEGIRPRRNRRPKVSRDRGDLRSAVWLGQRPATTLRVDHFLRVALRLLRSELRRLARAPPDFTKGEPRTKHQAPSTKHQALRTTNYELRTTNYEPSTSTPRRRTSADQWTKTRPILGPW